MRAWTNQLSNVIHLLILPVSLIFVIFAVAITHPQTGQTRPIQPNYVLVSDAGQHGVEPQQAYVIPNIADDYAGSAPPAAASNSPTTSLSTNSTELSLKSATKNSNVSNDPGSSQSSTIATSSQSASTSSAQNSSNSSSDKLDMLMSTVVSLLKL